MVKFKTNPKYRLMDQLRKVLRHYQYVCYVGTFDAKGKEILFLNNNK